MCKAETWLSVVLCTYNGEKYIKQQLDSLISQSYQPIEIIVTDDLSTDNTWKILGEYAAKYPFIKIHQNETNLGFVKNFEKAIRLCNGDYIALSDQDDVWMPEKLSTLINHIADNDLIYHDSVFIDENDQPILGIRMSDHYNKYDGASNLPFLISNCVAGHAMLFKKSLLPSILPFENRFYHDWWITFVAITSGKIKAIPDVLVKYRQHDLSITDSLTLKPAGTENQEKGYLNFDLKWIEHCMKFSNTKNPEEVEKIYKQLKAYTEGERGLRLFVFLLKYYHLLFYFHVKKKSPLSRLNTIRKISFG
ncbi:MAG: glycosyltransferase family 2 protein [Sphingobacteriales bacterium]|nr:MAG: glycosyltransferase family 2 protein [Sphingobacteriales bacterium]